MELSYRLRPPPLRRWYVPRRTQALGAGASISPRRRGGGEREESGGGREGGTAAAAARVDAWPLPVPQGATVGVGGAVAPPRVGLRGEGVAAWQKGHRGW